MIVFDYRQVRPLVESIYRRHAAGCCLHIALDDGNLDQGHIEFCLDEAKRAGHEDCVACAEMMLWMSKTQRRKTANSLSNWVRSSSG